MFQAGGFGGNLLDSSGRYLEYDSEMLDGQSLSSINVRESGTSSWSVSPFCALCTFGILASESILSFKPTALGSMIKRYSENPEGNATVRLAMQCLI